MSRHAPCFSSFSHPLCLCVCVNYTHPQIIIIFSFYNDGLRFSYFTCSHGFIHSPPPPPGQSVSDFSFVCFFNTSLLVPELHIKHLYSTCSMDVALPVQSTKLLVLYKHLVLLS